MECTVVGCCCGVPYDGMGAVVYTDFIAASTGIPLFQVQEVEDAGNLGLATVLCGYIISCKKKGKRRRAFNGIL